MSRVLAVASGKGGTGKTSLSVNLAVALGRMGRRVCLLDADLGLSNVDVVLGITPGITLEHVLFEGVPMERAIVRAGPNLEVVPGGSGVARLADLSLQGRKALAEGFSRLSGYDYLIVDGSPGISGQVISLCLACPELLVVVNPDPSSITDAYALVKVLAENGMRRSPWVLLNRVKSAQEAAGVFSRLRAAMGKYLRLDARLLGHVPQDPHLAAAAARQRPLVELYPASAAGRAVLGLALALDQARLPAGASEADPASVMGGAMARMRELAPAGAGPPGCREAREALDEALALAERLAFQQGDGRSAPAGAARTGPGLHDTPGGGEGRAVPTDAGRAGDGLYAPDSGQASGSERAGRQLARLRALLARARDCLGPPDKAGQARVPARTGMVATLETSDEAGRAFPAQPDGGAALTVSGAARRASPAHRPVVVAAVVASDEAMGAILRESLESVGIAVSDGQGPYGSPGLRPQVAVAFWRGGSEALFRRLLALGDPPWVLVRPLPDKTVPPFSRPPSAVLDMPYRVSELARAVIRLAAGENDQGKRAAGSFF